MAPRRSPTRIVAAIGDPFDLDGHQVMVGTSIGIAVAPPTATGPTSCSRTPTWRSTAPRATAAAPTASSSPTWTHACRRGASLELDLRQALADGEFELHYQPLVNLEHDEICGLRGAAALAPSRARHGLAGRVHPAGRGDRPDRADRRMGAARRPAREAATLAGAHQGRRQPVAGAVQAAAIWCETVVARARRLRPGAAAGWSWRSPNRVLLQNSEATLATLHELRELGVRIAHGRFRHRLFLARATCGASPSTRSRSTAASSPIPARPGSRSAIVRAVAEPWRSLGMTTTAEGVETEEQLQRIREEGLTEMQGYVFSPPRPIKDITRLFLTGPAYSPARPERLGGLRGG